MKLLLLVLAFLSGIALLTSGFILQFAAVDDGEWARFVLFFLQTIVGLCILGGSGLAILEGYTRLADSKHSQEDR
jgi:hypothetical protein